MRILLVDDSFTSRRVMKKVFEHFGECECVPSADVALSLVQKGIDEQRQFDLCCLDLAMAERSGLETIQVIREMTQEHQVPKCVILSSVEDQATVRKCFDSGVDGFLHKPLEYKAVERMMNQLGWNARAV